MRKARKRSRVFRIRARTRSYQLVQTLYQLPASCPLYSASVGRVRPGVYLLNEPCQVAQEPIVWDLPFRAFLTMIMSRILLCTTALQFLATSFVSAIVASVNATPSLEAKGLADFNGLLNVSVLEYGQEWRAWKVTHRRSYVTLVEELERFVIWRANQAFIDYHNSYADKLGFTLRMNQFGDLVRRYVCT